MDPLPAGDGRRSLWARDGEEWLAKKNEQIDLHEKHMIRLERVDEIPQTILQGREVLQESNDPQVVPQSAHL